MKPATVTSVPVSIGKGGRGIDVGCRLFQGIADLEPRHHHFDGDHGVIDEEAQRDDQGAERNALQRNAGICHHDERDGEHQRDRDRDDQVRRACPG